MQARRRTLSVWLFWGMILADAGFTEPMGRWLEEAGLNTIPGLAAHLSSRSIGLDDLRSMTADQFDLSSLSPSIKPQSVAMRKFKAALDSLQGPTEPWTKMTGQGPTNDSHRSMVQAAVVPGLQSSIKQHSKPKRPSPTTSSQPATAEVATPSSEIPRRFPGALPVAADDNAAPIFAPRAVSTPRAAGAQGSTAATASAVPMASEDEEPLVKHRDHGPTLMSLGEVLPAGPSSPLPAGSPEPAISGEPNGELAISGEPLPAGPSSPLPARSSSPFHQERHIDTIEGWERLTIEGERGEERGGRAAEPLPASSSSSSPFHVNEHAEEHAKDHAKDHAKEGYAEGYAEDSFPWEKLTLGRLSATKREVGT